MNYEFMSFIQNCANNLKSACESWVSQKSFYDRSHKTPLGTSVCEAGAPKLCESVTDLSKACHERPLFIINGYFAPKLPGKA